MRIPIRAWHIHITVAIRIEAASNGDPTYRDRVEGAEQRKMDFYAKEVEQMNHARRASLEPSGKHSGGQTGS